MPILQPLYRARYATMAMFFGLGMIYASWGLHVPTIKEKFGLAPAALSLALFAVAGGSIAALTQIGPWAARVGTQVACRTGGWLLAVAVALIMLPPSYPLLLLVLALFGVGNALFDVAINAEATALEAAMQRPVMSSMHAMFSVGGMVGAAVGGELLARGMPPALHLGLAGGLMAWLVWGATRALIPSPAAAADAAPAPRHGREARRLLWTLGAVALVALIAEGAMYDWSAVYMHDIIHADAALTGLAYATFSGGMALGRFSGDWLRARLGNARLVLVSGLTAGVGITAALLVREPFAVLSGFGLMGLGLANMIPILFAAAANVKDVPRAVGIAHVAGTAYVGLLLGPVLIGLVAQAFSLPWALALVALCAVLVGGLGRRILRVPSA